MSGSPGGRIPVEAILALALDRSSAEDIKNWLDDHEKSWSNIEKSVSKIGDTLGDLTKYGMGLAGVAGIGAVAQNFFGTSQMGSNVALASGMTTGGAGAWHPYSQALLSAQAKTGVSAQEIGQGLIQALQSVGGNLTPNQAAIVGGLLAGYGQTVGLTPSQVSQAISPLLAAANRPLTAGNLLSTAATITAGLTAAPGSQAAPLLGLISSEGVQQALGSQGAAGGYNLAGLTAVTNSAIQANNIWRSPSLQNNAYGSISGALQGAYGNPQLEAFMQMAGVSYGSQRKGLTAGNLTQITGEATKLYGTGNTRDVFLRSVFGTTGADFLEDFTPGSKGAKDLQQALKNGTVKGNAAISQSEQQKLLDTINHAQAATTPNATIGKLSGKALQFIETPGGALATLAGGVAVKSGAKSVLGELGSQIADDPAAALGRFFAGGAAAGLTTFFSHVGSTSDPHNPAGAAMMALGDASGKHFKSTSAEEKYLRGLIKGPGMVNSLATGAGEYPGGASQALSVLNKWMAKLGGNSDPIDTFSKAAQLLYQAAQKLAYQQAMGSAKDSSFELGTSGLQAIGSSAPGLEFTALTSGGTAGAGGLFTSYGLGSGGGSGGSGGKLSSTAPGTAASRAAIQRAAKKYGIPASVLEGIYGAESTYGTAYKPGQKTYGYFGLTGGEWSPSMSFQQDANAAAGTLADDIAEKGSLNAGLEYYSGGSYGLAHVKALGGAATKAASSGAKQAHTASVARAATPAGTVRRTSDGATHIHVYVDGHKVQRSRVLRGHKS